MNEEKKLDEKTLEEVNGGLGLVGTTDFCMRNCLSCKLIYKGCPYYSADTAVRTLGGNGYGLVCPERVEK